MTTTATPSSTFLNRSTASPLYCAVSSLSATMLSPDSHSLVPPFAFFPWGFLRQGKSDVDYFCAGRREPFVTSVFMAQGEGSNPRGDGRYTHRGEGGQKTAPRNRGNSAKR